MCVWVRAQVLTLQAVPGQGCGRGLGWCEGQLFCPMPGTPEASGWQSLGQGSKQVLGRELTQGKARVWQGKGLCPSLAVEQHERAHPVAFGQGCVSSSTSRSTLGMNWGYSPAARQPPNRQSQGQSQLHP